MVKFLDLKKITDSFEPELGQSLKRVVDSGYFIRGKEVGEFEREYAAFIGTKNCVGVGNGFDAISLIFKAYMEMGEMKEGDEIIVPANTYIASLLAISETRLVPVLAEPNNQTYNLDAKSIEQKISSRTRGILVVHLYGQNALLPSIEEIAKRHGLKLIEDNAQAAGCFSGFKRTGSLGHAAAHSFYPTKNLGALGDGGAVTSDDTKLSSMVKMLGNYGSKEKNLNPVQGVNSRLDELQAAVLRLKLKRLDAHNKRRHMIAKFYLNHIEHVDVILPAAIMSDDTCLQHVWHLFVVRSKRRDALQQYLHAMEIECMIHYPIPPHQQEAYQSWNAISLPVTESIHREVLSLPISPVMQDDEVEQVVNAVSKWR